MMGDDPPAADAEGRPAIEASVAEGSGDRPTPSRAARAPGKPRTIRRVPKPRMTGLLDSPVRNLTVGVAYTVTVMILATAAYMTVGWSFKDAIYMVIVTVYTVA
jgi:hypothetical protein